MKKVTVSLTAGVVLALAGAMIGGSAQAVAIAPAGLRTAADEFTAVDKVQFIHRGKRYCWYNSGWRGPGWYVCGTRWRRGVGWGGPSGWRGWRRPVHRTHPPKGNRPGVNRPGGGGPVPITPLPAPAR